MGIATILEAPEIGLIAIGENKAPVIKRLLASPPDPSLPASFLKTHVSADYEQFVTEFERLVRQHGKLYLLFDMTDFLNRELYQSSRLWNPIPD